MCYSHFWLNSLGKLFLKSHPAVVCTRPCCHVPTKGYLAWWLTWKGQVRVIFQEIP